MPSNNTAPIEEDPNYTFPEFLRSCALDFGIERREGLRLERVATLPSYVETMLAQDREELGRLERMTREEVEAAYELDFERRVRETEESNLRTQGRLDRYARMRAQVEAWDPLPLDEKVGADHFSKLKSYMLRQIDDSTRYVGLSKPPERGGAQAWHEMLLRMHRESLASSTSRREKALAQLAERNLFVGLLMDNFPVVGDPS